jgi:capsular polysaccharide export protein
MLAYAGTGLRLARGPLERRRAARAVAVLAARGAPWFLFAMQMEDDYSLRAYSSYPDLDTPMRETIASFARRAGPGARLVFKIHPLDPGLKNWRRRIAAMARAADVEERVCFLDGGNLERLIRGAAGVVTVNSTVGLRAIELGRPVALLGEAVYRVPGVVFGGPLDEFWSEAPAPEPKLAEALLRALAAVVHVRGSYYAQDGIAAAAEGLAWRLHHDWVNKPLPEVSTGVALPGAPQSAGH